MATLSRALEALRRLAILAVVVVAALQEASPAKAESAAARTSAQLEQLVAPIALYPDPLLSQVLMASTYPIEVVQAARWSRDNPGVSGQALAEAMQKQSWDPSVKSLTAAPQTLLMMSDKLEWTQQLGDAFLAQQKDVLDAVQKLRARADENGYLKSTPEQKVTTTRRQGGQQPSSSAAPATVYAIEPTNPDQYYVPVYDPGVVYGAWPYPDYLPFYWYPPDYAVGPAFGFGGALLTGAAIWGTVNWLQNRVQINPLRYNNFNRTNITNANWAHNPAHRGAVPYRDRAVAQQFGNQRASEAREAFRGKADAGRQQLSKGKDGGKAGTKAGAKQAGAKQAGSMQGAGAKQAGSKQAARSKQGGQKQAARSKQGGKKQAARSKQTGSKQAARPKQTAGTKQRTASRQAARPSSVGQRSFASGGRGMSRSVGRGGGGARGGGRGGGGRRSDVRLKDDIVLLGRLDNGLGFYRFAYKGSNTAYVGVMAQEVQTLRPAAVSRSRDGYLRVSYDQLGLTFRTYDQWIAAGGRIPRVER
jgi:Protein of unknown function (DUF3300)